MTTTSRNTAIVKRLREMLLRQREKFRRYLELLEREGLSIENEDTASLQMHLEMEKGLIAEIHALRKVIDPLEEMYKAAYPQIKERNVRNRALLEERMNRLRQEMSGLRVWPRANASFPETIPNLVDIRT
jgi:U3 small nucleolar RNA-associated protein 14